MTHVFFQFVEFVVYLIILFSKFAYSFFNTFLLSMKPVSHALNTPNSFPRMIR